MTTEQIRLVIWDLDETFWKGTVSEGGIKEYLMEHQNIVTTLAKRGIISSICSKNNFDTIKSILEEKGIWDHFVFPSIDWSVKGHRVAKIIENFSLRPETVLFIDDNPNNLAEAKSITPKLNVADEKIIPTLLDSPLFIGKDDSALSRLNQYKLLEQKFIDSDVHAGDEIDFLRTCDIKVRLEYDIEKHIDRAIELINRTNQLNYTKRRLPESPEAARAELLNQLKPFDRQAALVEVSDKYGDYGYVGFFMLGGMRKNIVPGDANNNLFHFCFSCRTLGMYVEKWVYEYLNRPELIVVGEVITNLNLARDVGYISLQNSFDDSSVSSEIICDKAYIYGGCEAHIYSLYLKKYFNEVEAYGNYAANGVFFRVNRVDALISLSKSNQKDVSTEAEILQIPVELLSKDIFGHQSKNTLYVMNLSMDIYNFNVFKNDELGLSLHVEPRGNEFSFNDVDKAIEQLTDVNSEVSKLDNAQYYLKLANHLKANYKLQKAGDIKHRLSNVLKIIEAIPVGSKIIFVMNHDKYAKFTPAKEKIILDVPEIREYTEFLSKLASTFDYVGIVSTTSVIKDEADMTGVEHYARAVYARVCEKVVDVAKELVFRSDAAAYSFDLHEKLLN